MRDHDRQACSHKPWLIWFLKYQTQSASSTAILLQCHLGDGAPPEQNSVSDVFWFTPQQRDSAAGSPQNTLVQWCNGAMVQWCNGANIRKPHKRPVAISRKP
ncbi:hypothetical protein XFLM_01325 [Xylella fastidiosa subsp. fastidiosa GB514]|nr:hypothetical protein XFLM_01325 [Xylella fastidiosa subsp. fastidiosa GB514]TNV93524.1 hypothetical protein C5H25_06845 [Xylella fastidiosa]TNW02825.1 hypothetical protein C5H24_07170 [Xylella fastidiosa]TNW16453.1 hypothetical protein C5H15_07460 [Xylella fastidiosa]TNW20324.1 hypothetical protein C5H12_06335 [Xylella fastidiosa]